MMRKILVLAFLFMSSAAFADSFKPNPLDPSYNHDRWGTSNNGILVDFTAYSASFDDADDDNGDGVSDAWGQPEWVAYEIKHFDKSCIKTALRPSKWITDPELRDQGLMPEDHSYGYSAAFRSVHKDWFDRGHLIMKLHAERVGSDAAWNTHTFYNAVPQRHSFNAGIWLDLEDLTAAWAQHYGSVWIVTGPIFIERSPIAFIGEEGEFPVGIPDALFKIVIKEGVEENRPDVLAFIYPQIGPGYFIKPYVQTRFLTNIDEIEKLTGIDFLTSLPNSKQKEIEKAIALELWPVEKKDFIKACGSPGGYND